MSTPDTNDLPSPRFEDLHDLDKGAVLLHAWKASQDGARYATEHYPCRFLADETLCALDSVEASRLARSFGSYSQLRDTLGRAQAEQLYDLALDIDRLLKTCPQDVSTPSRRAHTAGILAWLAAPDAMDGRRGLDPRRPYLLHATGAVFVDGQGTTFGHFEIRR